MKVCFVSHSSAMMGAERALLELIDALKDRGVECSVIVPSAGPMIQALKKRNVPVAMFLYPWWVDFKWRLAFTPFVRTFLSFFCAIPIAWYLKQQKADIVYTNGITVCAGAIAAKLLDLPHIWQVNEFGCEDQGFVFELGESFSVKLMNRFSAFFLTASEALRQKFRAYIPEAKIKTVHYSIRISDGDFGFKKDVPASSEKAIRCLVVGRLQKEKGQEDAIRAIGLLRKERLEARLSIVGSGKSGYPRRLKRLVSGEEADRVVRFFSYVENAIPYMKEADVILMCSKCEALGRVSIEAMKVGKPVIGTRSGGTTELIREGFNGFLYTPGDYRELAEKIKYLLDHPEEARRLGENGRAWANEQFNSERFGTEVLEILKAVTLKVHPIAL